MGVRDRIRVCQAEPTDTIEVSSQSSYSSVESLNLREMTLEDAQEKQLKSRRNLKGWLRKNRRAAVPVAQTHLKASSTKYSRRAARLQGQLACLPELPEDKDDKPLDIYSFVNSTKTAFTPIVTDDSLLQEWDVELQNAVQDKVKKETGLGGEMEESYDWCTDLNAIKIESAALNPEMCYRRIGKSARTRLNMPSKVHFDAIKEIEEELVDWFTAFPDSVMIKSMKSPYDRLLFHSVCRYMNLSSYSVTQGDTKSVNKSEKKTYVQYQWDKFEPPRLLLSEYLPTLTQKNVEPSPKKAAVLATNDMVELSDFTLID